MARIVLTDREGRVVEVEGIPGRSIMENIRDLDASVAAICGGMCSCATCHVYIAPAWRERLPPRSFEENVMLRNQASFEPAASRLSCQIRFENEYDGIELAVAPED